MERQLQHFVITGFSSLIWIAACTGVFIGYGGELDWVAASLLGLYVYAVVMLWSTVHSRRIAPVALMFWLFHTNFLLLPALSQALHRVFFWSSYGAYRQGELLSACAVIFIGLLAVRAGGAFARRRLRGGREARSGQHFLNQPLSATWRVQLLLLLITAGLAAFVASTGPGAFMSLRIDSAVQDGSAETGLLRNLPRALAIGVLLFSIYLLVQRWRHGRRVQLPMLLIFLAALGLNAIINYPLGLARFWFFGILVSLIWILTPLRTTFLRGAFVAGVTLLQFTLFPWFSLVTRGSGDVALRLEALREYLHFGDFDAFQSLVNIIIYVREAGFELGRNLASAILFFLPRSLWADKASPLGVAAAEHMGYHYTNLSAPLYGEFYTDFGLLSLLLGMALVGYGMRLFDDYYNHMIRDNRYGPGILLTSVLAGFVIILLRGSLLGVISSIATLFGMLVLCSWLSIRGGRRGTLTIYHARGDADGSGRGK